MPTLEEMKKELEELEAQRVKPFEELETKQKEIKKRFETMLMSYWIGIPTRIKISLDSYWDGYVSVEVLDKDSETEKTIFGTDISIYIRRNYDYNNPNDNAYKVEINTGTCGSFNKDDYGQISKYTIMGALVTNLTNIEKVFIEGLNELKPFRKADSDIYHKIDRLECDIRQEETRLEKLEFEKTLDYTKIYEPDSWRTKRDYFEGENYIRFDRNTENYTYIQIGYLRCDNGQFDAIKTKRFYKGAFLDFVKSGQLKVAQNV